MADIAGLAERYNKVMSISHDLGLRCRSEFEEAKRDRTEIEQRWLKDLRQYKGIYETDVQLRMDPKKCKAFAKITRTKVRTMDARMMDLLFPSTGEKNWSIKPTPEPEIDPAILKRAAIQWVHATGSRQLPPPEVVKKFIQDQAAQRSEYMSKEMEDQLTEIKYRNIMRAVLHSGNLYGTGVLKGPMVERRMVDRWQQSQPGGGSWQSMGKERLRPFIESVAIWDIYPDMTVTDIESARYLWQRHTMSPREVGELGDRPGFSKDLIVEYLRAYPEGDYEMYSYESELLGLSESRAVLPKKTRKYEVLERWGSFLGKDLIDIGVPGIPEEMTHLEFESNIWLLGPIVIKAVLSPIRGIRWPYYFYFFEKDESCICGEGIPAVMRDSQGLHNAAVRATYDNAGLSVGNIFEVLIDRLVPGENPYDIHANRVFVTTAGDNPELSQFPVVRSYPIQSHTTELLALQDSSKTMADEETTIPRYLQGTSRGVGGAGDTASGFSMLMGNVRITEKDQVQNFDSDITVPFITALYHWNMQFNDREDVKGDYEIHAQGLNSLMAKEVLIKQLTEFAAMTNNPEDSKWIKRGDMLRKLAKQTSFGDDIVRTEKEVQEEMEREFIMRNKAQLQALMDTARERGMDPDKMLAAAIQQAANKIVAMRARQGQGQPGGGAGAPGGGAPVEGGPGPRLIGGQQGQVA